MKRKTSLCSISSDRFLSFIFYFCNINAWLRVWLLRDPFQWWIHNRRLSDKLLATLLDKETGHLHPIRLFCFRDHRSLQQLTFWSDEDFFLFWLSSFLWSILILSLSLYIYIYTHIHTHMYVYIWIFLFYK